jgi:formamidopyrimidine-DNA glycosylase
MEGASGEYHPCAGVWLASFTEVMSLAQSQGRPHPAAMPELPEVETTRRGLAPHVEGRRVKAVTLRRADLRWPIPDDITRQLPGQRIDAVRRRAKYLLFDTAAGSALLHLGMSGSLRVLPSGTPLREHDHVDILLQARDGESGRAPSRVLRFNDPRRFGCLLWQSPGETHPLLRGLGPEPLSEDFDGDYLFARSRGRRAPVKAFLMDQRVVVGVGNIYAAEALFAAGVSPLRAAGRVSLERYRLLADEIKRVLLHAITRGGTTLRDFLAPDGAPGYFDLELAAYGRGGEPCPRCGRPLKQAWLAQRATVWCGYCQR